MAITTTDGEITAGAERAIRAAMLTLRPYAGEPQVEALISKLAAIASPVDGGQDRIDRMSKALIDCTRIAKSEDVSAGLRERAVKTAASLEKEYLEAVSPVGSAVRKRDREALGVA